ncbi:LysM peptidoglycan-binding domain-containing protein [uncultured Gelidibacter sp.]|uniref:LysM peptidoglycan-binding domain-containing protein n=1 Tax=uncultured Gelidibacter sp. TaxID=259318 RepID=UPI002609B926|nr:LysM peptidoglycan-binding domain-containing protein [uncultured Gelidibacter sp.]
MFFTLFFLCFTIGTAQEDLKKHTISSDETLSSIAKKYNVTPYDLQLANPGVIANLKVGDVLIIPTSKIKTPVVNSLADSLKASVKRSSISYTVKKGDTKFGLSKRFDLTVPELESQNPQIVGGLQIGQVLEIHTYAPFSNQNATTNNPVAATPPARTFTNTKNHRVSKGETLWSISQANGLTVVELTNANPSLINGVLKEDQIVKIPTDEQDAPEEQTATSQPVNTPTSFDTYVVQKGDSKFGLSQKFNVSIADLERENPHIISMLVTGHKIKIPTSSGTTTTDAPEVQAQVTPPTEVVKNEDTLPEVTKPEPVIATPVENDVVVKETPTTENVVTNEAPVEDIKEQSSEPTTKDNTSSTPLTNRAYSTYVIKPKETLFGLSKRAGMTIPEFLVLNPQLKESVQIGAVIKMPKDGLGSTEVANVPVAPKSTARYTDLKASANTSQSKNLLFFLPFSQTEFQNHAVTGYKFDVVSDEFKKNSLEFYQGASIAIDSLKKLNLQLNVDIIETLNGQRNSKVLEVAKEKDITKYDAIVLPFYDNIEEDIAAFTAESKTPVITASTIARQSNTNNLYSALPSINQQRLKVLNYMKSKQAHIIVLSDVNRGESKAFIERHIPNADFINIKKNGTFNEKELIAKFKKNQLNFVVLDSERNSVFLSATTTMLSESSNYKLQLAVLESSLIPDANDVSQLRFRILKMIYPSLGPAIPTLSSKQFIRSYQKKYNLQPTTNVMLGFDITFDSLLRMLQQESFQNSAEDKTTEYTKLKFDYEKNALGGFSNEGIYILQYDSDNTIKEAN